VENCIHGSGVGFKEEEAEAAIKTSLNEKPPGRGRILVELLKKKHSGEKPRGLANAA
jgi:hypothetical protein